MIAESNHCHVGKKNLPIPEEKGGKMYRYWIALNFHTTRRYMKLLEINYSILISWQCCLNQQRLQMIFEMKHAANKSIF